MLPVLIIVLLSLVIGPTRAIFASDQCVTNAFYNETSALCECDPGFKGLGDLCCDRTDDTYNCHIGGDPWLTSYTGARTPLNFPCLGRVAVLRGTTPSGSSCQVELISTGKIVQSGAIYPDRIVASYTIKEGNAQYVKIVGETIQRPEDPSPLTPTQLFEQRKQIFGVQGEIFRISYEFQRKLWSIFACGTRITFRPAADDKATQDIRPGMCVSYPKSSEMSSTGEYSNGDVCSISSSQAKPSNILNDFLKDMTSSDALSSVLGDYESACEHVNYFAELCGWSRYSAATSCMPLLYNPAVRLCLTVSGMSGPAIVKMFSYCMGGYCNPVQAHCAVFVANYPALGSCFPSFCSKPQSPVAP